MISSTVIGQLGRDAELRSAGNTPVVSFNMASNDGFGDKKTTTWVRVSFFGQRAEKVAAYLTKGKTIAARGSLVQREYQGRDGTTKTSLELRADDIELLGGARGDDAAAGARRVSQAASEYESNSDEIPF